MISLSCLGHKLAAILEVQGIAEVRLSDVAVLVDPLLLLVDRVPDDNTKKVARCSDRGRKFWRQWEDRCNREAGLSESPRRDSIKPQSKAAVADVIVKRRA